MGTARRNAWRGEIVWSRGAVKFNGDHARANRAVLDPPVQQPREPIHAASDEDRQVDHHEARC